MAATEAATTTAAAAPAPVAAAGAGGGDPGAIEAALAEARRAAAAGGATVGEEEDFPKGMTMVERLRKEPPLEIETVKVDIENLEVIGKLVTYNKSVLKDDEQNPVGDMYPIFMSLPAVYLKPKNMPKLSPGNIFQVAKDWHDYKAAFYFLYRCTGGSATAVCVLELLEKNTKGEVQTGSKAMFVEEYSAMKLLSSPRSCDDNDFVVAGGPLVSEWSQLKKKGRVARREAAKAAAAAQKAEAEKVAAEKVEAEKAAAESKKSKASNGKGSKGQNDTVDGDEEEDDGEDDDPLAQFKDKSWIKTNMVSKNQVNRRAPLREQLETVCATLKIKPVPSTMGLMRDAIYLKLKLNEPSPAEAAASRRAEEEAAAAKVGDCGGGENGESREAGPERTAAEAPEAEAAGRAAAAGGGGMDHARGLAVGSPFLGERGVGCGRVAEPTARQAARTPTPCGGRTRRDSSLGSVSRKRGVRREPLGWRLRLGRRVVPHGLQHRLKPGARRGRPQRRQHQRHDRAARRVRRRADQSLPLRRRSSRRRVWRRAWATAARRRRPAAADVAAAQQHGQQQQMPLRSTATQQQMPMQHGPPPSHPPPFY